MRPAVRQQLGSEETLARPHVRQAVQLQGTRLRQILHAPVVVAQAHESARQEHSTQRLELRLGQPGQRQRQRLVAGQLSVADTDTVVDRLVPRSRPRRQSGRARRWQQQPARLSTHQSSDEFIRMVHLPKCGRNADSTVDGAFAHRTSDPLAPPSTIDSGLLTLNHPVA